MDRRITLREILEKIFGLIPRCRSLIPEYVKDYVSLNQFSA